MKTHRYTVLLEREKEAIQNIKISISYRLETLIANGKPIPKDDDYALHSGACRGA